MGSYQIEDEGIAGDNTGDREWSRDGRDSPLFPVVEYIEPFGERLDK